MTSSFPPGAVPSWMHKLKNGAYMSNKILERCLFSFMTEDEACQAVQNAIKAGILVPKAKGAVAKTKLMSLCFSQNLGKLQKSLVNDPYCFECHLSGDKPLKKCLHCVRTFHAACQRKIPLRPNYSVPSDRGQAYRFPLNESDMDESDDEEVHPNGTTTPAPSVPLEQDARYELDCNSNINMTTPNSLKLEAESCDDVFFVSEQPARQRKRCSSYIKQEEAPHNEVNNELELCTPCRLLKLTDLLNPPHVSIEELNCLLGFSWQKHHSWLKKDVRKYMAKHWNNNDSAIVKNTLFTNDILGKSDISHNIETQKFKHLSEFLIDLLDLQHNIGVFFGTKCEEYNATKWLVRDITHDIREIRRCSDCYRHSNESNRSTNWFAKPCTQRHELVFAKQHGSRHWPAKVIRVMTKKSSIFDVRFFGGAHSRALISARDILPIDADISHSSNKLKMVHAFKVAMRELRCHMMLLHQPMYKFNFFADPREAENLIQLALPYCMADEVSASLKRPRAATPASAKKRKTTSAVSPAAAVAITTPRLTNRLVPVRRFSVSQEQEVLQDITLPMTDSVASSPSFDTAGTVTSYRDLLQEVYYLNEQLTRTKADLEIMCEKLKEAKRKKWCQQCQQEATFDCCFNASYCSDACKRRDRQLHQVTCCVQSSSN